MPIEHSVGGTVVAASQPDRSVVQSLWRGFRQRCPCCGEGAMFRAYLKVNDSCPRCGEELHHHRADDAPPYFTIVVVGHIVVGSMLVVETNFAPPLWMQMVGWPLLALALSLALLPRIKGALVGLQWALRMHGFDPATRAKGTPYIDYDPMHPAPAHVRAP